MSVSVLTVVGEPDRQAAFWASVLGYEVNRRNPEEYEVSGTGAYRAGWCCVVVASS